MSNPMTNTPSSDEDRELIEHMDVLLAGFAGENDLRVGPHMLAEGVKKGRDRIESLLSDRAKLEEALKRAERFIRDVATTDTIIMADTLEAEANAARAALHRRYRPCDIGRS